LGFEKSQRSVTHDSLRYINILTYLLTSNFALFDPCKNYVRNRQNIWVKRKVNYRRSKFQIFDILLRFEIGER